MTAGTSGDVSNLDIEAVGLSLRPMYIVFEVLNRKRKSCKIEKFLGKWRMERRMELFESKMGFKALKKKMD